MLLDLHRKDLINYETWEILADIWMKKTAFWRVEVQTYIAGHEPLHTDDDGTSTAVPGQAEGVTARFI
jgi:hypothetical protein